MSVSKRSSMSPPQPAVSAHDLRQRVIACLNKLSDRDTLAQAINELESIARVLTQESFAPFLSCIHNTDSSSKSPVRKQCVHLLSLLSRSHGDALSPFLSKMISTVVRRLRDSDSAVRTACVEAAAAMSSQITRPPFSAFLTPLMETLTLEQDINSQIGSALCLAAVVDAAPDPDVAQLRRILPKLGKLAKSEGFKAKAALLVLIGSIVVVGGASSRALLDWLVPCVVEFLSSDDWTVRKAAAETLGKVAVAERDLAVMHTTSCTSALESRRFDKIKIVRETINQTLELWRGLPTDTEEVSAPFSSSSSPDNGTGGCFAHASKNSQDSLRTPFNKTLPTNRSPPSVATAKKATKSTSSKVAPVDDVGKGGNGDLDFGDIQNTFYEKVGKFGSLKSGSRVVPFTDDDNRVSNPAVGNGIEEMFENHKDIEDMSLIRDQLLQIENQQSSLLDILQRFVGSTQSGMNSLETRVQGLEMALEEISYGLAVSSGRIANGDPAENTCCKLPGAEFLSPKFWRRSEGRFSGSKFASSGTISSPNGFHSALGKDGNVESCKQECERVQPQSRGMLIINPLAGANDETKEIFGCYSRTEKSIVQDSEGGARFHSTGGTGAAPSVTSKAAVNRSTSCPWQATHGPWKTEDDRRMNWLLREP